LEAGDKPTGALKHVVPLLIRVVAGVVVELVRVVAGVAVELVLPSPMGRPRGASKEA